MKLTPHFSLNEPHVDCRDGTPYPEEWIETRLRPLFEQLEILRAELGGRSMVLDSVFRTEAYNRRIGGARKSQHVQGRAADIRVIRVSPAVVHDTALRLVREGRLIIGGLGSYPNFTHIDVRPGRSLAHWWGNRPEN